MQTKVYAASIEPSQGESILSVRELSPTEAEQIQITQPHRTVKGCSWGRHKGRPVILGSDIEAVVKASAVWGGQKAVKAPTAGNQSVQTPVTAKAA